MQTTLIATNYFQTPFQGSLCFESRGKNWPFFVFCDGLHRNCALAMKTVPTQGWNFFITFFFFDVTVIR